MFKYSCPTYGTKFRVSTGLHQDDFYKVSKLNITPTESVLGLLSQANVNEESNNAGFVILSGNGEPVDFEKFARALRIVLRFNPDFALHFPFVDVIEHNGTEHILNSGAIIFKNGDLMVDSVVGEKYYKDPNNIPEEPVTDDVETVYGDGPTPVEEPSQYTEPTTTASEDKLPDSELEWSIPANLRWLAEQSERPDYVPCGMLTGVFLFKAADRLDALIDRVGHQVEPEITPAESLEQDISMLKYLVKKLILPDIKVPSTYPNNPPELA